jgi:SAM-dependent methyltransferase
VGVRLAPVEDLVSEAASMPAAGTEAAETRPACRLCGEPLERTFVDLGASPLANSYLTQAQLLDGEVFYPLCVYVCERCLLVQLPEAATPEEIFSDYAYFSSYSDSWVDHARGYVEMAIDRFELGAESHVIEIASNDGYLLQFFKAAGVPVLGVEPAANVAEVAREKGIPTEVVFFGAAEGSRLAASGAHADLALGNNVLAHVPDCHDLVEGLSRILKPSGVVTMEFPHLLRLIDERQFDTIYHEHFSYFSLYTVEQLFAAHELRLFDVEEIPTHGGSLRIFAAPVAAAREPSERLLGLRERERTAGLHVLEGYVGFDEEVREVKRDLLTFLIDARREGKTVAAYGAAAKGNTLLNYCGIRGDLVDYVVDRSPHKQGRFLPGTRIPIFGPEHVEETRPDLLLILPWNIREEIIEQMAHVRAWGGRFVVPIPEVRIVD